AHLHQALPGPPHDLGDEVVGKENIQHADVAALSRRSVKQPAGVPGPAPVRRRFAIPPQALQQGGDRVIAGRTSQHVAHHRALEMRDGTRVVAVRQNLAQREACAAAVGPVVRRGSAARVMIPSAPSRSASTGWVSTKPVRLRRAASSQRRASSGAGPVPSARASAASTSPGGSGCFSAERYTAGQKRRERNSPMTYEVPSARAKVSFPAMLAAKRSASYSCSRARTKAWALKYGHQRTRNTSTSGR